MAETAQQPGNRVTQNSKGGIKKIIALVVILALIGAVAYFFTRGGDSVSMGSMKKVEGEADPENLDQWSYANGFAIGTDIKNSISQLDEESKVNQDIVMQAIADVVMEKEPKMTQEQVQAVYVKRNQDAQARLAARAQENTQKGAAFLAEYKDGSGVEENAQGVLYKVLEEGDGEEVGSQVALVQYTGKKIDGTVFDSSENNGGNPIAFSSTAVIPGLGSVLSEMSVGDKYEVAVPAELAYGQNGVPGVIEPNEALVFELEVTGIQEAAAEGAEGIAETSTDDEEESDEDPEDEN